MNAAWADTFDCDLSNDYTQRDEHWLQQTIQVQTAEGPAETRACVRDLDDSLRKALHDKHKLGQSNQISVHFQLWDKVQPFRFKPYSDALWTMPSIPESHKRNIFEYRTGQIWNKSMAFQRHVLYMPGQAIAMDTRCSLCRGDDSEGHISGSCVHPDMSKQYIARHDKAMRTDIQAFTKGQCGSHYLIAGVGKIEGLKDKRYRRAQQESSRICTPRQMFTSKGLGPCGGEGFLAEGSGRHMEQDEARHDDG